MITLILDIAALIGRNLLQGAPWLVRSADCVILVKCRNQWPCDPEPMKSTLLTHLHTNISWSAVWEFLKKILKTALEGRSITQIFWSKKISNRNCHWGAMEVQKLLCSPWGNLALQLVYLFNWNLNVRNTKLRETPGWGTQSWRKPTKDGISTLADCL